MEEQQKNELKMWLVFYLCKGLGPKKLDVLKQHTELTHLLTFSEAQLASLGLSSDIIKQLLYPNWYYIDTLIEYLSQHAITAIYYSHPCYPSQLKEISAAPLILFCKGNIDLLCKSQIAVVGSRSATPNGIEIASEFASAMSHQGIVVTSGLAGGIDTAAHKGALAASGETIAVVGTGVDVIYPKKNRLLFEQLLSSGLIVSELLPGTKAHASHFPRRNRIIAGLSLGVLVVEAEIKSGSLITARYAIEQNREVFAVPGSLFNPYSHGCHYLIKQGAKLTETLDDIFEELGLLVKNGLYNKVEVDNLEQADPVLTQLGYEATSVDVLAERTQIPVEQLLTRLLDLELANQVERVLGGYIKLRSY